MSKFFKGYIGQEHVVSYCSRVCEAVAQGRRIPLQPLALLGHAGLGKNNLTYRLRDELTAASKKEFSYVEVSNSTSLPNFISIWANLIEGKKVLVFLDEAHNLKNKKVVDLIKRLLETEREVRTVRHEDNILTSNPFEQLFVFASNEEPNDSALFGPTSRTKSLKFIPFSDSEVVAMMKLKASRWPKFKIDQDAIEYLKSRVLPNGRAISELIENECLLMGNHVSLSMAKQLVKEYGRFPNGLRREDIKTLLFLGKDTKGRQVNEVGAACDGEDSKTTSYRLQWLAGLGYIFTHSGKKFLTAQGEQYLQMIKKMQDTKKK